MLRGWVRPRGPPGASSAALPLAMEPLRSLPMARALSSACLQTRLATGSAAHACAPLPPPPPQTSTTSPPCWRCTASTTRPTARAGSWVSRRGGGGANKVYGNSSRGRRGARAGACAARRPWELPACVWARQTARLPTSPPPAADVDWSRVENTSPHPWEYKPGGRLNPLFAAPQLLLHVQRQQWKSFEPAGAASSILGVPNLLARLHPLRRHPLSPASSTFLRPAHCTQAR